MIRLWRTKGKPLHELDPKLFQKGRQPKQPHQIENGSHPENDET